VLLLTTPDRKQRVETVAFSPDGAAVAGGTNTGAVYVWPAGGGPAVEVGTAVNPFPELMSGVFQVGFTPDGRFLLAGVAGPPGLLVREAGTWRPVPGPECARVTGFSVAPDGGRVVAAGGDDPDDLRSGWVRAFGPDRFDRQWDRPVDGLYAAAVAHFPGGDRVAVGLQLMEPGYTPVARPVVLDAATGAEVTPLDSPNAQIGPVAVAPDGSAVVAVATRSLLVWPAAGGAARKVKNTGPRNFTGIAFHPSGRHLAATSNDTTVKLFDTAGWAPGATYTWQAGKLRSVAFSPDGLLAAAGTDSGKVVVWDVDL
jgi:WD40 repeat protein